MALLPTQPAGLVYNSGGHAAAAAYAHPGALVIAGRDNYGASVFQNISAAGGSVLIYIDPIIDNPVGRYHDKMLNASEFGAAVPRWPGNPQANEHGFITDFRVGSILQSKMEGVLELMIAENPHMAGFFFDDTGSRSWWPSGYNQWESWGTTNQQAYRDGAIALLQTARDVCDAHGLMLITNGTWGAGSLFSNGGGYPDMGTHGCSLADGGMIEHHDDEFSQPQLPYFHGYSLPSTQWGNESSLGLDPVMWAEMRFVPSSTAAWVNDGAFAYVSENGLDYGVPRAPWGSFHDSGLPTQVGDGPPPGGGNAWTYLGGAAAAASAGQATYQNSGTEVIPSDTTSWVLPMPSGVVAGDSLVLAVNTYTNHTVTGWPSGTRVGGVGQWDPGDPQVSTAVYPVPGSPPSDITVTLSTAIAGQLQWIHLRGIVTATDPIEAFAEKNNSTGPPDNGVQTLPSVTTLGADRYIVGGAIASGTSQTWSTISGWAGQTYLNSPVGPLATLAAKGTQAVAGASGTAATTPSTLIWGVGWQMALQAATGGTGTTVAATYTPAVTAGSLLVAAISGTSGASLTSVTDTQSNTWNILGTVGTNTTDGRQVYLAYAMNATAGATTVTATWGSAVDHRRIILAEYSGIATSGALDVSVDTDNGVGTTGTDGVTVGPATSTVTNDLFIVAVQDTSNVTNSWTAGSFGWVERNEIGGLALEDAPHPDIGAILGRWTTSVANRYGGVIAGFKIAVGGGTTVTVPNAMSATVAMPEPTVTGVAGSASVQVEGIMVAVAAMPVPIVSGAAGTGLAGWYSDGVTWTALLDPFYSDGVTWTSVIGTYLPGSGTGLVTVEGPMAATASMPVPTVVGDASIIVENAMGATVSMPVPTVEAPGLVLVEGPMAATASMEVPAEVGPPTDWPTASTTGATGTLTSDATDFFNSPGQSHTNKHFTSTTGIQVGGSGDGITFTNCRFASHMLLNEIDGGTLTDCTFDDGFSISSSRDITLLRAKIENFPNADGIHITNDGTSFDNTGIVIQDCYIYNSLASGEAHADGMQIRGSDGLHVDHCYVDMGPFNDTHNAAFYAEGGVNGANTNMLIENNFFKTGNGYTLYIHSEGDGGLFRFNTIADAEPGGFGYQYAASPVTYDDTGGNTVFETGLPYDIHSPPA